MLSTSWLNPHLCGGAVLTTTRQQILLLSLNANTVLTKSEYFTNLDSYVTHTSYTTCKARLCTVRSVDTEHLCCGAPTDCVQCWSQTKQMSASSNETALSTDISEKEPNVYLRHWIHATLKIEFDSAKNQCAIRASQVYQFAFLPARSTSLVWPDHLA